MIIFEGPDGSGKSTAVERVADHFNLNKLRKAVSSDTQLQIDPRAYLEETLRQYITREPWLLDRFYLISGSIYMEVVVPF